MNATTSKIISRLPTRDLISPIELAIACGFSQANGIINKIADGSIAASKPNGRYVIAREECVRFIIEAESEAMK